jgi:hypothetical protein
MKRRFHLSAFALAVAIAAFTAACSGTNESITAPSAIVPETTQASSGSASGSGGGDDTIRVRCERRGTRRSKASVDGNNLASGSYRARLTSGANSATSAARNTVGDEVEFDFDSNRNDIAEGATAIARDFIQGGEATGELLNANGQVVASATVACEVR